MKINTRQFLNRGMVWSFGQLSS